MFDVRDRGAISLTSFISPPHYWGFDVSPPRFWGFDVSPSIVSFTTFQYVIYTVVSIFLSNLFLSFPRKRESRHFNTIVNSPLYFDPTPTRDTFFSMNIKQLNIRIFSRKEKLFSVQGLQSNL
jgi:hypothetical protein